MLHKVLMWYHHRLVILQKMTLRILLTAQWKPSQGVKGSGRDVVLPCVAVVYLMHASDHQNRELAILKILETIVVLFVFFFFLINTELGSFLCEEWTMRLDNCHVLALTELSLHCNYHE
ncbi:hypothetical protein F2P56_001241 [Juglans regia]|uniref:Uncharacterized protein n=1 Tax=Juglans regia TaxID=51240 RepID=A0A833XZE3_JUGRE|nr:hypothetical protein F2P56_001237 [Juglans regia]KAF5480496.1 hypothetical protein F2P56_001241 [Juglans regia]